MDAAMITVMQIHLSEPEGDILLFLTGACVCVVWCGVLWCGVVWHGVLRCGVVCCGVDVCRVQACVLFMVSVSVIFCVLWRL